MHSVQSALGSAVGHVGVQPELHTEEQELKKKGKGGGVAKTGSKWERKEKRMEEIRQKQVRERRGRDGGRECVSVCFCVVSRACLFCCSGALARSLSSLSLSRCRFRS
eukprot:1394466-Rhodomonas_salina.1